MSKSLNARNSHKPHTTVKIENFGVFVKTKIIFLNYERTTKYNKRNDRNSINNNSINNNIPKAHVDYADMVEIVQIYDYSTQK